MLLVFSLSGLKLFVSYAQLCLIHLNIPRSYSSTWNMTDEEIDLYFTVHLNASTTGTKQFHLPIVSSDGFLKEPS